MQLSINGSDHRDVQAVGLSSSVSSASTLVNNIDSTNASSNQNSNIIHHRDAQAQTNQQIEQTTAETDTILSSDYALDVVFGQFEKVADKKMALILNMGVEAEVDLEKLLGEGGDLAFDKLIRSLASIAKNQQTSVIARVIFWRRKITESLDIALVKRVSESAPLSRTREVASILKERQSIASAYILCRSLIEIVKRCTADTLPDEFGERLENMVFNQYNKNPPDVMKRSKNRTLSLDLFSRLIGELSNIRFASVSDRFIAELEKYNNQTIMKERQSHMEMLIEGMRYLKIKASNTVTSRRLWITYLLRSSALQIYPVDALEETADFLSSCASFFKNAHGAKVKHAYAKLFVQLLLPIAEVAVAEVNFPAWSNAVDMVYPRALKMILKPRHILAGYPLVTTLLCVSKKEFFTNNWLAVVDSCYQKFNKDRYTRQLALGCLSRLTWTYLFRCTESTSITFKKMDNIIKTLFPPLRRAIYPSETPLDHFILITYFTLMRDIDNGMTKVIYYLLTTDASSSASSWEHINPERVIIGLRAFRMMLGDAEWNVLRPPFPAETDMIASGISMTCSADVFSGPIRAVKADTIAKVEDILSKILLNLDQPFGRFLVLDEKNIIQRAGPGANYSVPIFANTVGTSDSGPLVHHQYATFSVSYTKDKQPYFDVLKTVLDSMPRLMPAGISLSRLVEIISRYTVHIDPEIIQSASQALLRIAAQIDSQTVVTSYSRFIYRIEDRAFEVLTSLANGPLTGGNHNGNGGVMKLYVDLLTIWVEQIDLSALKKPQTESNGTSESAMASMEANIDCLFNLVEETEANGLLFLSNQSSYVRRSAIQIIKTAARLEQRLQNLLKEDCNDIPSEKLSRLNANLSKTGKYPRLFDFLESAGQDLLKFDKDGNSLLGCKISIETRIRLQQHQRRGAKHVLIQIAESDHVNDTLVWNVCLPEIFKLCFQNFPGTVALCRQNICVRLVQLHPSIVAAVEAMKAGATGTLGMTKNNSQNQKAASTEIIDQWQIYLVFACTTATSSKDRSPVATWANSGRKGSAVVDKIATPRDLFLMVLNFLTCEHRAVREGAIHGLGHVNKETYRILMSELTYHVQIVLDDGKQRNNQKPYQNKRSKKNDRLRISLMHVLQLTADCLVESRYLEDKDLMNIITSYIKETKSFLADSEVQLEWEYHKLRVYLCGLVEKLYENIMRLDEPTNIMSFETRLSLFKMFEEWCGYGMYANVTRTREAAMMRDVLDQCKDSRERASMTQLMEEERKALETAALSAMATLCRGPLYAFLGQKKQRQAVIQFDMLNVLRWIDAVFESHDPKYHTIARRALEAILTYNQDQSLLIDDIIEQCYAGNPKLEFTQGYFQAFADIVCRTEDYPCHIHQIMSLAVFKAGDSKKAIRKSAIHLLRTIEERVFADSCANEYEIGVTSSLPAIYKHTQTLLSARLALDHPEQTYSMLSEITQRFEHISPNSQREVLIYMLPWLRKVDLSVGPQDNELSASAFMVLSNLFYITIKFGDVYVKEIAALWSQLVDHGRNVRAVIMYLLDMGLEKRNPWFLIHAKRVFVCLGRTQAFNKVVEEVIAEITPRSMVPQLKDASNRHAHAFPLLFVADTEKVLPPYAKRPVFSRGQLAMVFLVDLAIESGADLAPHLPLLLHSIFVQLDHLTSIVCDQSRCFLINLIHSIVVRQSMDSENSRKATEVIQWLTSKEGKRLWAYENITSKNRRLQSAGELKELLQRVVDVFSREDPDLRQKWGETALKWATCCSVRHIACRSFQCFRALMPAFNQHMLADMLARLSNTIADKSDDIRGFALEIILTLTEVADAMDKTQIEQFPQLFWAAVACLYSPYEAENSEALLLLRVVLDKYGFVPELAESFPKNWSSEFDGLQPLLLKALQFSSAEEQSFSILTSIMLTNNPPLIDPSETRLMYLLLGSLPRLLHGLDGEVIDESYIDLANRLTRLLEWYSLSDVQRILATYPKQKSKFQEDFLNQVLGSIRDIFLAKHGQEAFVFSVLLVKNRMQHYREKGLMMVENLAPYGRATPIDLSALEPLLQLVQSEYAEKALSILNAGIPAVPPPADDLESLVWSMTCGTDTAARITRHNVHAVVFECSSITNESPIEHNIQFSIEDFTLLTDEHEQHSTPMYIPERTQQHGEDLINALKDLDDFFNEDVETTALSPSSSLTSFHRVTHDYRPLDGADVPLGPEAQTSGVAFMDLEDDE
ncbi:Cell morphoproteinsis protein PAG1 [Apophysomyces ossiformis]|uniref:Cell morphoproteinsis protein PAG1 n=1 Tax=Apophysomyces ossiformis TaxID=679940 RepID=A0A8H7EL61_9FUNG|nr:Cell morphoproteinsis protein PAG1 [Apophysomyces ossiformis]